jgi:hypothetical protein
MTPSLHKGRRKDGVKTVEEAKSGVLFIEGIGEEKVPTET